MAAPTNFYGAKWCKNCLKIQHVKTRAKDNSFIGPNPLRQLKKQGVSWRMKRRNWRALRAENSIEQTFDFALSTFLRSGNLRRLLDSLKNDLDPILSVRTSLSLLL